jgi:DNA-directed RNA polymerase subunit RPC12/RpoP
MKREELVCVSCGKHFQVDGFSEELGELVTCPSCGSLEIEIDVMADDAAADEPRADAA